MVIDPSNRNGLIPFPRIGKRQEGNNIPNFDMFDKSVFEKSQEGFGNTSPLQYRSEKALDESGKDYFDVSSLINTLIILSLFSQEADIQKYILFLFFFFIMKKPCLFLLFKNRGMTLFF